MRDVSAGARRPSLDLTPRPGLFERVCDPGLFEMVGQASGDVNEDREVASFA